MNILKFIEKNKDVWLEEVDKMREMVLANLVMVSQIPAPTFHEEARSEFILNRYVESDLSFSERDDLHNVVGVLEGKKAKNRKKIMLS